MTPANICSPLYDQASEAQRQASALLLGFAPSYATMTSAEVDAALAEVEPFVNEMLSKSALFPRYLKINWWFWSAWVLYAYVVSLWPPGAHRSATDSALSVPKIFVAVAIQYFSYIKRSMARVATLDTQDHGRQLRLAWLFATLTSTVVTLLGVVYFDTSLAVAVWTKQILSSSYLLSAVTLISL